MRLNTLTCAVLALALAAPSLAVAQGPGQRNDRGDGDGRYARPDSGPGYTPPMNRGQTKKSLRERERDRQWDQRSYHPDLRQPDRRDDRRSIRGAGAYRSYWRGDRLPPSQRQYIYVVEDWRGHRLSAPAPGQQWVQSGTDYLLIGIATGVILGVILSD